jgi:outer membrane biosynthesis protein TonB
MAFVNATERRDKQKGLVSTLIFHGLLLLLFAFYGLTHSIPPPEEGMVINFGTTETGLGNQESEPMQATENVQEEQIEKVPPPPTEAAKPVAEEQVLTQETEEEIYFRKEKEAKEKAETERKREEERKRQEQERLQAAQKSRMDELFAKAKTGQGKGTGGGEGNTKPGGNQGHLDGTPGAPHGNVPGSGNSGVSFNLSGRKMIKPPNVIDNSQETGKVVVDIIVDKYGKVVMATPGARGSTTTNSHLYKLAKEAAIETKFDANPNASVQQQGSMTFVFILE